MTKKLIKCYIFSDSIKEAFPNRKNSFKLTDFLNTTHIINNSCYYIFYIKKVDLQIVKKICENYIKNYHIFIIDDDDYDCFNIPIPTITGGRRTIYSHRKEGILNYKRSAKYNLKDFKTIRISKIHIKKISKGRVK